MRYDEMPDDQLPPSGFKAAVAGRCFWCGNATRWIDFGYEGYVCSPECDQAAAEHAASLSRQEIQR